MDKLPILFFFNNTIPGLGFQAQVVAQGRALLERGAEEEGEVWVSGVQPGGIAEGGKDEREAYRKFREFFRCVLLDIAAEAEDFEVFESQVRAFFDEVCVTSQKMWWRAVHQVRVEKYTEESLKKRPADTPVKVTVERIGQLVLEHQTEQEYDLAA